MTSVVTNDLRTLLFNQMIQDVEGDSTTYYVGISRAENYTPDANADSRAEQFKFRNGLQAVKVLSNASFVVPTVEWQNNDTYSAYTDQDPNQSNFYVINSINEVFICVESPNTVSTTEPTAALANNDVKTFATGDGYLWRYMYTMSNLDFSNFKTRSYMPVKKVSGNPTIAQEIEQLALQNSSVDGEILGFTINSSGTTYPGGSAPLTISGTPISPADFSASISGGGIESINLETDSEGDYVHGEGYVAASAEVTGGDGTVTPIFAPQGGLNTNPIVSLKSKSLMLQVDIQGDETGTILAENDFRQVALIRNPRKFNSDSDFTGNTGIGMKRLNLSPGSATGTFPEDAVFRTSTNGATGKVFFHDTINERLYYYQDLDTGFEPFTNGLTITDDTVTASILSQTNPDIDAYSGDILYLNNVSEVIDRTSNQTEDIRIVIELG